MSVPFVRSAADVAQVRAALDAAKGPLVKIIAQIDCADAIRAVDEIIAAADGVMVSRTNLGMDIPASKVPLAQKWLIQKANLAGKPAFVAGQVRGGGGEDGGRLLLPVERGGRTATAFVGIPTCLSLLHLLLSLSPSLQHKQQQTSQTRSWRA